MIAAAKAPDVGAGTRDMGGAGGFVAIAVDPGGDGGSVLYALSSDGRAFYLQEARPAAEWENFDGKQYRIPARLERWVPLPPPPPADPDAGGEL